MPSWSLERALGGGLGQDAPAQPSPTAEKGQLNASTVGVDTEGHAAMEKDRHKRVKKKEGDVLPCTLLESPGHLILQPDLAAFVLPTVAAGSFPAPDN